MSLVYLNEEGLICIGPLTIHQYKVVYDSLEFASAWTERSSNPEIAKALQQLIPAPLEISDSDDTNVISTSTLLFDDLPDADSSDIPCTGQI